MSVDKRSVFTDATATLGQIIDEAAERDAVHIAVEPIQAAERLYPGQHVKLSTAGAVPVPYQEGVGIVDPFLGPAAIEPGQQFWLFVYPRTITSLRHVWAHPKFGAEPVANKTASEAWLRNFCETSDCPGYESVIDLALNQRGGDYGNFEYLFVSGSDAHGSIPPEFWDHVEIVTGQTIPRDERAEYFSCSC